jgi:hypothetical protein
MSSHYEDHVCVDCGASVDPAFEPFVILDGWHHARCMFPDELAVRHAAVRR